MHLLAGVIHVQFFNPALEFGCDLGKAGFVEVHDSHRAHRAPDWTVDDHAGAQIHLLDRGRIDQDCGSLCARGVVLVNRRHIHAHAVLARGGADLARIHGGPVIFYFALASGRRRVGRPIQGSVDSIEPGDHLPDAPRLATRGRPCE